jgi:hypothetical protein
MVAIPTELKQACRVLAPASVRIGHEQTRRLSFLADAAARNNAVELTLSPFPGDASVGDFATIDFATGGERLFVGGRVAAAAPGAAVVRVTRGPSARPARQPRVEPSAGRLVATFVPEGAGLGSCCQPVLDINQRALRLASHRPFAPGMVLRRLVVVWNRDIVRRCEGVVTQTVPRLGARGDASWECVVMLRAPTQLDGDSDRDEVHEITDAARVRGILWAMCDLSHPVTLRYGGEAVAARLEPVKGSRDALPPMRCTLLGDAPLLAGAVQVESALYGSGYRVYARVRGKVGPVVMLSPAPVVREWHRRAEERLVLRDVDATIAFSHPLTGQRQQRRLEDASVIGVGFRTEEADTTLWMDLPLTDVRLQLGGVAVRAPSATVRSLGKGRCGLKLASLSERESDHLRVELARLAARPIHLSDGDDLDSILRFHESVRLLEPDMQSNLGHALDETRRQWRVAHRHPDGLMRTAMVPWKGGVGATLTLVRAYESSWVLQHSAVASPAVPANPGMLHSLLVRLAIPRADGEYVCGYIDEEAKSQHAVMGAFFSDWSTPEHRGATRFVLYSAPSRTELNKRSFSSKPTRVRKLGRRDELLVENAALRALDPVCARALGLRAGEITLQKTQAQYARVGLERRREAWATFDRGRCSAILLREIASPGLCLSSLLSAGVLLPVRDDAGDDLAALAEVLLTRPLPGNPPYRFLLAPEHADERAIVQSGFRRVAGCTLYAMHRFGLSEYHRYVATRYGFLHGRLRARTEAA